MKRNIMHTLWMAAVLPLCAVLASCEQEDFPEMAEASGTQTLSITVTDGGYAADGKSGSMSRAVENYFSTVFTDGDKCGLYIVRDGNVVYSNVCLTAKESSDGSLTWEADRTLLCKEGSEYRYFLYYPYKEGDHLVNASATKDTDFFELLIVGWEVNADQSSYADYTASDLMTAAATTSTGDGRVSLSFSMTHRMALAIVHIPGTVYKFTDSRIPDYTVVAADFDDNSAKPCLMSDNTYRYIVNHANGTFNLSGSFAGGNKKFTISSGIPAGYFKRFIVDYDIWTTINDFNLQVGDFILRDGHLVNKNNLTEAQTAKVAAVVFWTPAETNTSDSNRLTPARLTDDEIMAIEHPNCTHGLAVALSDVSTSGLVWQQNADVQVYYAFQNTDKFDVPNKSKYKPVMTGTTHTGILQYILGYQNTKILRAYNEYCSANNMQEYIVHPVVAIDTWATSNPAPQNSTGWFFPSTKELHILCHKDDDKIYNTKGTETKSIVNNSLGLLGASVTMLTNDYYWSSFEVNESNTNSSGRMVFQPYYVHFKTGNVYNNRGKNTQHSVRAVCAF